MKELITMTNEIAKSDKQDVAKQILGVCMAITPQFYKKMSMKDLNAEKLSIALLVENIDNETLAEMCKRAVEQYPKTRAENPKAYFDINYILTFYKDAFNYVHCDSVKISKKAEKIDAKYDEKRKIIFQKWVDNGQEIMIGYMIDGDMDKHCHLYTPKDFEQITIDLSVEDLDDFEV